MNIVEKAFKAPDELASFLFSGTSTRPDRLLSALCKINIRKRERKKKKKEKEKEKRERERKKEKKRKREVRGVVPGGRYCSGARPWPAR